MKLKYLYNISPKDHIISSFNFNELNKIFKILLMLTHELMSIVL